MTSKGILKEVLTPEDLGQYLHLSKNTVYFYLNQHYIPARKIGNTWRVLKSELELWLKGGLSFPEIPVSQKEIHLKIKWGKGKPQGLKPPLKLRGKSVSEMVIEDRR